MVAAGTTVVRALETAVGDDGRVAAAAGWTRHIVTPVNAGTGGDRADHRPARARSSHLMMLTAIAGREPLALAYEAALREGYLWHEFGDTHLLLAA